MEDRDHQTFEALQQVVSIVSAYVSHNSMRASDLPELIQSVNDSLQRLKHSQVAEETETARSAPAVAVKKSVHRDYIVCLEDGKKFKSLRRHLASFHGLTPEGYREKWSLPPDYPMVAPSYSETRSRLARHAGLGQAGGKGTGDSADFEADGEPEVQSATEPKVAAPKPRRGRPKASAE